jgi:ABC-type Fe3+ transport system substrate-binding protein
MLQIRTTDLVEGIQKLGPRGLEAITYPPETFHEIVTNALLHRDYSIPVRWIGSTLDTLGREFLNKMAAQELTVQNMSGAALAGLVASGEVPLSPTIFDADVTVANQKNAPIQWRALDPVVTMVGYSGVSSKSSHPHAALLFLDYLHGKEGQQLMTKGGLWSPREDMGSLDQKFQKIYLDSRYSLEEIEKNLVEWEKFDAPVFYSKKVNVE